MKLIRFALGLILILIYAGCQGLPLQTTTATPQSTPAATVTVAPTVEVTKTTAGPVTLRIWLPPQFDPASGTPAGEILQARLDAFLARRTGVRLDVRIKALDGPGGLLDALTTANAAAPLALPDLLALPRPVLEAAALKGLLRPFDGLTDIIDGSDWYDYARQLARIQNSIFGLPFAGDALIMVYRPAAGDPPLDWSTALTTRGPLIFPAADPQAIFTLALYQAAGGSIQDDQGRPFLDNNVLVDVLTFYQEAESAELMPYWLTQYQTDDQAWEAFTENRGDLVITWNSYYLRDMLADTAASPIPTPDGTPFTLATGWVWALAGSRTEHQDLSVQLAEFLCESNFLAEWTTATGYLPPRPSALAAWQSASLQSMTSKIVLSARLYPSTDVLNSLAPPLEQATVQILKQQADPATAADSAAESLVRP